MALDSSTTQAEALAQYNNNLAWEGDVIKAALALEAVRWLLANRPTRLSIDGRSHDYESFKEEKVNLESFVERQSGSVNRSSFVRGRMLT